MYGVNEVTIIGDINKEPTFKIVKDLPICEFLVKVKRKYYKNQEVMTDVQDVKISCFGRTAEGVRDNIDIGDRVFIKARARGRSWEGKHYVDISAYEIIRLTEGTGLKPPELVEEAPKDDDDDLPF